MASDEKKNIIKEFIRNMDLSLPITYHFRTAMYLSLKEKWEGGILVEVMKNIEEIYKGEHSKCPK